MSSDRSFSFGRGGRTNPGKTLNVFVNDTLVGHLSQFPGEMHQFKYADDYNWDSNQPILTLADKHKGGYLVKAIHQTRSQLPPFFSNLLPEGPLREYIADKLKIHPQREFQLISELKNDLPGAIWLDDGEHDPKQQITSYYDEEPSKKKAKDEALRFSLAGVQLKFSAVQNSSGGLTIPAEGTGGSYIVKLPSTRFQDVPENEYSMMLLAEKFGIFTAEVDLEMTRDIENLPANLPENFGRSLIVKRFDRGADMRFHMEDFAQIFGVYPRDKYKHVSNGMIAYVVWTETGNEGLVDFLNRLVFNLFIGNADMHLKNWTMLYVEPQKPVLAPGYDYVSTIGYMPDYKLALSIAGEKNMHAVTLEHFRKMAAKAKLPEELVARTVKEASEKIREIWQKEKNSLVLKKEQIDIIDKHQDKILL